MNSRLLTRSPLGAGKQRGRDFDAERLHGLEIDRQLKLGRLLHRKSAGFGPLKILSMNR